MQRKSTKRNLKILIWVLILVHVIITFFSVIISQVAITKPSLDFGFCNLPSNYHILDDIVIQESNKADFSTGTSVSFHIPAPMNIEFQPNTGFSIAMSGGNISSVVTTVSALNVIIQFNCSAQTKIDRLTISGLSVRAVNTSGTTIMKRNGGNAIINGMSNNTELTGNIISTQLVSGLYRTVTNLSGNLDWYQNSTWECGLVPPNDGTADVIIRGYNGAFSSGNVVLFSGNTTIKSIQIESNANFSPAHGNGFVFTVKNSFTILSGGFLRQRNWIQSGLNTIKIGGNFINHGEMLTDGTNNAYDLSIELNGVVPQSIYGSGIFRMIGNGNATSSLIISNMLGVTLKSNFSTQGNYTDPGQVVVDGYLLFDSEQNQFTGSGSLILNGKTTLRASTFNEHFAMTGIKTIGSASTIEFTHPSSLIGSMNIPSLYLNNLILSVGNIGKLELNNTVSVGGTLTMNTGIIQTNGNILELGTSTTNLGALNHVSGMINGKFKRWFAGTNSGNSSGLFPLSDLSSQYFRFVLIEYIENTVGGSLQAEWITNPMGNDFDQGPVQTNCDGNFTINKTASGYWNINPSNGITTNENKKYKITLKADGITDFSNACHITSLKKEGVLPWSSTGIHVDNQGSASSPLVQRIDATGWSNWGFAGDEQPLPVELIDFYCKKTHNKMYVHWSTISEFNSMLFELFRSFDGEEWLYVDSKFAAGMSNEKIEYQIIDTMHVDHVYYLLKQIDLDGKTKTYGPISSHSNFSDLINFYVYSIPNQTNFKLSVINPYGPIQPEFIIKDFLGRTVQTIKISLHSGFNDFFINTENLDSGVYYLSMISGVKMFKTIRYVLLK
jgi:hypothetical protein